MKHKILHPAGMFGLSTMVGAYLGARIATLPFVTGIMQMLLFATMMLLAALFMIRQSLQAGTSPAMESPNLKMYPKPVCKWCWLWLLTEGIGVGVLTGLVGVGGGFAIVPALVLLANVPMKQAIGTSLLVIVLNSIAGFLGYFGRVILNLPLMMTFTIAASLGIMAGAYLVRFVKARDLQKAFGYFILGMAAFIFWQNWNKFVSPKKTDNHESHQQLVTLTEVPR
jgi:uncharacterized protein